MANSADNPFPALKGQKYLSLASFRKSGAAVLTPLWFAEQDGRLYVMTRSDSGKMKRIRNHPRVRVAPCTMRGRVTGPWAEARARLLPLEEPRGRRLLEKKYLLMRIPWLWSRKNVFLELAPE
jgi:PPOX class probable F420-dependent enzyme